MKPDRYASANVNIAGKITSSRAGSVIHRLANNGDISIDVISLPVGKRLDHIAHEYYDDGSLWWIIAAASGIGWWLHAQPGSRIVIPINLDELSGVI